MVGLYTMLDSFHRDFMCLAVLQSFNNRNTLGCYKVKQTLNQSFIFSFTDLAEKACLINDSFKHPLLWNGINKWLYVHGETLKALIMVCHGIILGIIK